MDNLEFRFPFKPYPLQIGFMRNLYDCIESRKLGIFESPTGTGKSLSVICGSLTWLEKHMDSVKSNLKHDIEACKLDLKSDSPGTPEEAKSNLPSWFNIESKKILTTQKIQSLEKQVKTLDDYEKKVTLSKENGRRVLQETNSNKNAHLSSNRNRQSQSKAQSTGEESYLLQSDSEDSADDDTLLDNKIEETNKGVFPQIIIATRTHSQISQLVNEVKNSPFGKDVRVCSLGSRVQLCVNEDVVKLRNPQLINQRCIELHQKKKPSESSCTDQQSKRKKTTETCCTYSKYDKINDLKDVILSEVADIENLVTTGRKLETCPYYASRFSLPDAQVVVVPYSILLHKSTREAIGLQIEDNIVIIDEAHNLLDVINSMHSTFIQGPQILNAHQKIQYYQGKYSHLLSPKNLLSIKQLLFVTGQLLKFLEKQSKSLLEPPPNTGQNEEEAIYDCANFCLEAGIDHINVDSLVQFCERTKLPFKLANMKYTKPEVNVTKKGLSDFLRSHPTNAKSQKETEDENILESNSAELTASMLALVDFLRALVNANENGRILCRRTVKSGDSSLKYLLLNPASQFGEFITLPRSVILVGGTMQPMYEFEYQLFGACGAPRDRLMTFSCGHIVSPDHVLPVVLTKGASGKELDFSWSKRSSLLDEIAVLLLNLSKAVPSGVVCFLPSYDFENQVFEHLKSKGFVDNIERRKKLFREPKKAGDVDKLLTEYESAIRLSDSSERNGALLICVIGGKLSEGINFSDDLARCVVVIGLPFANSHSVELQERMNFLNRTSMHLRPAGETRTPGQLYYESLCFKAVNQSIGRAIRHSQDYAAIILADFRYARPSSISYLPGWISQRVAVKDKFGQVLSSINQFLRERAKAKA